MTRSAPALVLAGALTLGGCGGAAAVSTSTPSTPATGASTSSTATPSPPPGELGDRIGELYLAAFEDLVAALADRPDPATATMTVSALKETYIQELVALGGERELLDDVDRATVDARVAAALNRLPTTTFEAYQQTLTDYRDDPDLSDLIASFNIIGQYANFDLLRDQEPDEAARLGIG